MESLKDLINKYSKEYKIVNNDNKKHCIHCNVVTENENRICDLCYEERYETDSDSDSDKERI